MGTVKRSALLVVVIVALLASSSARADTTIAGQHPETSSEILALVHNAQTFWEGRNVKGATCTGDPKTWQARTLTADDEDAWGLGESETCEIWLSDDLVHTFLHDPDHFDDMVAACDTITHEVGHANGLEHSDGGIMAADSWGRRVASAPAFCVRAARDRELRLARSHHASGRALSYLRQFMRECLREDNFL